MEIVPAKPTDRERIYHWLSQWDNGLVYDELPIFSEFKKEEADYFYDASRPGKGMYYIIREDSEDCGCISYTCYHLRKGMAELDVWLRDESYCGRALGSSAINLLMETLEKELSIQCFIIRPSQKNQRAIRAYEKCGFLPMDKPISHYILPEYLQQYGPGDCGVEGTENMVRYLKV